MTRHGGAREALIGAFPPLSPSTRAKLALSSL